MTIKTVEQLNQEFINEQLLHYKAAKSTAQKGTTTDAVKADKKQENTGNNSESRIADSKSAGAKRSSPPVWKELLFLILKIALIILAFAIMFTFLFGFIRYGEPSMSPAIKDGDLVIYHRYTKLGYLAQDTIVLKYNGQTQARRVIATAGDVVDITEDGLIINGAMQLEMDIYQDTERYIEGVSFPLTVQEGYVFVLGDSRTGATDSRIYGPVKIDDTLGKVMAVIRRRNI